MARSFREINWRTGGFVLAYHVALVIGLPFYFVYAPPGLGLVLASVALLFLTEIGIGAAYHRFYAHRTYKMSRPAEAVLLFLATMATQGDALRWSFEHRLHHAHTDTNDDPYSIQKGFWYAHVLWLFDRPRPLDERRVTDLVDNPLVRFQSRYFALLTFGSNAAVAAVLGFIFSDYLGAFVLAWWTRLAVSHHMTWFVNSLCHCWGERTFSKEQSAVDNYVLAFLTVGEGYHNYHHTFPSDYRNGVRWYHVDPTKWTIWLLSRLGLARDLKRVADARIERRLLLEDRKLLVDHLEARGCGEAVRELKHHVEHLAAVIQERLGRRRTLIEEIARLERERPGDPQTARLHRRELKSVRQTLRRDWRAWNRLCGTILAPEARAA